MDNTLKIAVAGLGTVGAETVKLLQKHGEILEQRCGWAIQVVAVSARDQNKNRGVSMQDYEFYDDAAAMAAQADAHVIVELIGGADGIAKRVVETALTNGRHVVTANKALIAHHGMALAKLAEQAGVMLSYESAVAGGIPVIKAIREGLAGNRLTRVYGILNGTCNYILTRMRDESLEFSDVLSDAQKLGYAEADPGVDIDGHDAAHKLAIMAAVAFGREIDFSAVHVEGIRHISLLDIRFAEELGYRIKLLGIASETESGVEQRVHPCMVPLAAPIAGVEGVFNAVVAEGDFIDTLMMKGRGAGAGPTASAVAADLIDIARGTSIPTFGVPVGMLKSARSIAISGHSGAYYIRLMVVDSPGVFADIATVLQDNDVSMESILQHGRAPGEQVPVILTLHETGETRAMNAVSAIAALDGVMEKPVMIRIEQL